MISRPFASFYSSSALRVHSSGLHDLSSSLRSSTDRVATRSSGIRTYSQAESEAKSSVTRHNERGSKQIDVIDEDSFSWDLIVLLFKNFKED